MESMRNQKKVNATFRLAPSVVEKLKALAGLENRSPTNMLETLIIREAEKGGMKEEKEWHNQSGI